MTWPPGTRVYVKESITADSVTPAAIGTVVEDLDDIVLVRLDQTVELDDGTVITQWTDPAEAEQDVVREYLVEIVG